MNTPTKITVARIIMTPIMLFMYMADFIPFGLGKLFALILLIAGVLSDFLDGYLARKNNQVTDLGKFLDPIADKLLATTAIVLLITGANPVIPTIAGIIFMFINLQRDYVITGFRQIGQLKGIIIAADRWGKNKQIALYITLGAGMLLAYLRTFAFATIEFVHIYTIVLYALIGITCLLMIISEVGYIVNNPTVLRSTKKDDKATDEDEKRD
ncbi:MAG: CDP-diacylglycerol--glycerol-3-phosphate 3-phosphatidyltransferase [Clostridiales bacterium]|nr:CDP-diacylglycerol--glycerol-3-phosphate 3-phosphatidyltransferase [Clostridiales bacterium]